MSELKRMSLEGKKQQDLNDYSDVIMGIDLGTTNCAVAVYTAGTVPALCSLNKAGKLTMPSCVRWDGMDEYNEPMFTAGDEAYKERYALNTIYSIKRMMGSGKSVMFIDPDDPSIDDPHRWTATPAEVSAVILGELKRRVNLNYPGLHRCIITVPAYFNQRQIEDTIEASKLAGLDCVQILKEPTSASYIYSQLGYAQDGSILVYDLGGGTFDVTVMSFLRKASIPKKMYSDLKRMYGIDLSGDDDGSPFYCRVLGTYGDISLGGDDIDKEMARLAIESNQVGELRYEEREELVLRCEQFKKSGIRGQDVVIGEHVFKLSADMLERSISKVFDKTMAIVDQIPADQLDGIKTVVLVGGSTKSDYLVSLLEKRFDGKEISRVLDPDATVALGAGAVAKDVMGGKGAVYQDVLPMMIGVLKDDKVVDIMIPKNTPMPYCVNRRYHTMYDNQEAISVDVYQGVSVNPEECTYLGRIRVDGLEPKPAGEVNVVIYMMLNSRGRLTVTTVVDGIAEERQLVVDSIYGVNKAESAQEVDADEKPMDEFEEGFIDLCKGNEKLHSLLMKRRQAIKDGDIQRAEVFANQFVEAL